MANRHRGEHTIELGGGTYTLRYDMNALAELEDLTGKALPEMTSGLGAKFIRAAVYCGLLHLRLKGMTVTKVGKLLDMRSMEQLSSIVSDALMDALGIVEEDKEGDDSDENEKPIPLPAGSAEA